MTRITHGSDAATLEVSDSQDDENEIDSGADDIVKTPLTEEERMELRLEFEQLMRERFLAGHDSEWFDYTEIDNDSQFDDHELEVQNIIKSLHHCFLFFPPTNNSFNRIAKQKKPILTLIDSSGDDYEI